MPFPPNTNRTVKLYGNALDYAPPPGFAARWAPGTGPRRTNFSHNFHGPLSSPTAMQRTIVRPQKMSIGVHPQSIGPHGVSVGRQRGMSGLGTYLGDGDSLGNGVIDAVTSIFSPAVSTLANQVVAPAEQQLANLKSALSAILVLSAIAAGTGIVSFMRGR